MDKIWAKKCKKWVFGWVMKDFGSFRVGVPGLRQTPPRGVRPPAPAGGPARPGIRTRNSAPVPPPRVTKKKPALYH